MVTAAFILPDMLILHNIWLQNFAYHWGEEFCNVGLRHQCVFSAFTLSYDRYIFFIASTLFYISMFLYIYISKHLCFCVFVSYVPTIFPAIHQFPVQRRKLQHKFLFDMCKSLAFIFQPICINLMKEEIPHQICFNNISFMKCMDIYVRSKLRNVCKL